MSSSSPLQSAVEVAVNSLPPELPEPSDEELARGYVPGFPSSPDPNAQIGTQWGILTYREAVARERAEFVARKRRAIEERKVAEERRVRVQAESRARQEQLEADARSGRGRAALKDALIAYQEALEQSHVSESALVEARANQAFLRTSAEVNGDKFARSLGAAGDQIFLRSLRRNRHPDLGRR
jgi:hypothetical protein